MEEVKLRCRLFFSGYILKRGAETLRGADVVINRLLFKLGKDLSADSENQQKLLSFCESKDFTLRKSTEDIWKRLIIDFSKIKITQSTGTLT